MGTDAHRRLNGPIHIEVDFPRYLDRAVTPDTPEDVVDHVDILTPPIPTYNGAVGIGKRTGLYLTGNGLLRGIQLPVFESSAKDLSSKTIGPVGNQHYFTLTEKLKGNEYRTPRVSIGKIALLEDYAVCSVPVKTAIIGNITTKDVLLELEEDYTKEELVASAIFRAINGNHSESPIYETLVNVHSAKFIHKNIVARKRLRKAMPGSRPV